MTLQTAGQLAECMDTEHDLCLLNAHVLGFCEGCDGGDEATMMFHMFGADATMRRIQERTMARLQRALQKPAPAHCA